MDEHLLTGSREISPGQRWGAGAVVALMLAITAGGLPLGPVPLPAHPGFLQACGAVSLLIGVLTAGLFLSQGRVSGQVASARLGAGYLFTALMVVPMCLASPGVLPAVPLLGRSGTAMAVWCASHGGFALYALSVVWARPGPLRRGSVTRACAVAFGSAVGSTALAVVAASLLPDAAAGQNVSRVAAGVFGPAALLVAAGASVCAVVRLRRLTVPTLWLCVALLASCLDLALTLSGNGRFSVGWYAGRAVALLCSTSVLVALLCDVVGEARRVSRANIRLEQLLQTDVLTGMANRRAFDSTLDAEWRRAQREQTAISLLMVDIDSFKGFNDRYGHPAGDVCLRAVGRALTDQAYRPGDMAARLGGEEFGIILPVTEEGGALQVAERLRASVARQAVPHGGSRSGYVTVSVGAATLRPFDLPGGPNQLVSIADTALYQAKAAGRDTVRGCSLPEMMLVAV